MLPPFQILHFYWWLPMLILWFWHFQWTMHLDNRLCSKNRKTPDASLLKKTRNAISCGVGLLILYVGHLAVIRWENVTEALMAWLGGYLMPTVFVARNIQALRQSRRAYEAILKDSER